MKVLHISHADYIGGAAIAASRLNKAMCESGVDSQMLVLRKTGYDESVHTINTNRRLRKVLVCSYGERIKHFFKLYEPIRAIGTFSLGNKGYDLSSYTCVQDADIIYLHWIIDVLSIEQIESILRLDKPTFWFLHDMWPLTGGCHHSFNCNRYTSECAQCPLLQSRHSEDIVQQVFRKKQQRIAPYQNLHLISPSYWLANCAKESSLFKGHSIQVIPNIVDPEKFSTINKKEAKKLFGLPTDRKLILFGAEGGSTNVYKGWNYLMDALQYIKEMDLEVALFGNNLRKEQQDQIPFKVHSVGKLKDIYSISALYNAAEVYVTPTLAESFGQTIAESMACGTPVVGFHVGGVPEIIHHKKNGYLAQYKNSKDLAEGIKWILSIPNYGQLSKNGRNLVMQHFAPDVIANAHIRLWNTI